MFSIPIFAIAYLFKGGQFNKYIERLPDILGGKFIAALLGLCYFLSGGL